MPYFIKRIDQRGGYVSKPGSKGSYTSRLICAQAFETEEQANNNRCIENEIVIKWDFKS